MPVKGGPNVRTSQAIVWLDAADKSSYPGTGTTWINSVTPGTYNGTLNNTSFNSTDALGALFFSGSNTFADMGNIGAISASYTFQVAVKPLPTGSPYTILSYTSGSGTGSVTFRLDYSSSIQTAVFSAFASSGSVNKTYSLSTTIPTGSWSILHGRFNGSALSLFKNGSIVSTTIITGSAVGYSVNNRFLVGGVSLVTGSYLSGSIANVAVYNTNLGFYSIATNYNGLATRFGLPVIFLPSVDNDVQLFLDAAGITDPTQITAVTTLVTDLKTYNLWTKMKAIYPMVGGTATAHKYNLKNPQDTDAAFRLLFSGGWTHSNSGAQPNGVNAGANTFLNPATTLINRNLHLSYYSRTTTGGEVSLLGGSQVAGSPLYNVYNGNRAYVSLGGSFSDILVGSLQVFHTATSLDGSANGQRVYTNGVLRGSTTNNSSALAGPTLTLANAYSFSSLQCAFCSIGDGLTDTEATLLYTIVQTFNTTLSRQV